MCIVIDSNTISAVFKKDNAEHSEFLPVFEWITSGEGKMVLGGKKYRSELARLKSILKFITELTKINKTVSIDDAKVDNEFARINNKYKNKRFNDVHIVAIVCASGCRLVCTKDKASYDFIQMRSLYPKHITPPAIYSGARNISLLVASRIADCCKPVTRLNKKTRGLLNQNKP
ncbi:MAG: hypothetical protein RBR18_10960 [Desulfovibrionaceae bacterium]|nr:hypothetical protein [Desulfovibrionaceae bacterium]